jgi:pimeloyl-ACP methyl ester carboxylesterase
MADLCREGENTHAVRVVPIIFVPGVMGTRLHFPRIDESWNPDSTWDMLHWARISAERARRELHFSQPATIIETHDDLTAGQRQRGWAGMVTEFYLPFLRHLEGVPFSCVRTTVWAVGYDWRQGNRQSGAWLNTHIGDILDREEADEYVLISHSMGGLVARACLKDHAGTAAKLRGVIHVCQPVQGAPVFYRRMYTGAIPDLDGGRGLSMIMGRDPEEFATLLSGLRGPCELIPNNQYRSAGRHWLWGPPRVSHGTVVAPPSPFTGTMYTHYRATVAPPGIAWSLTGLAATALRTRMDEAEAFHRWLGTYKHPRTWAIYSTTLATDTEVHFPGHPIAVAVRLVRPAEGDGTVPASSASALFTSTETSTDPTGMAFLLQASMKQCEVSGVDHADAFNDGSVRTVLAQMMHVILFGAVVFTPPGDYPTPASNRRTG